MNWPEPLKQFVVRVNKNTDKACQAAVQAELKQLITDKVERQELWSTDWAAVVLKAPLRVQAQSVQSVPSRPEQISPQAQSSRQNIKQISKEKAKPKHSTDQSDDMLRKRIKRFAQTSSTAPVILRPTTEDPNVIDWDYDTIVGTSSTIEKRYLRLTSAPKPQDIRPLPVLQKTLDLLKRKWRAEGNYAYICDQFKSLRQDLTVQRIKNTFTVHVYEIHARIAMENGDLGEYNQCQATLVHLYSLGLTGNELEFLAYRIHYLLFARNWSSINRLLKDLKNDRKSHPSIQYVLGIRRALLDSNYHALFKLYNAPPDMSCYILDKYMDRERAKALLIICHAYQAIPLSFLKKQLGYESEMDLKTWLESIEAYAVKGGTALPGFEKVSGQSHPETKLDCKAIIPQIFLELAKHVKIDIKGQLD